MSTINTLWVVYGLNAAGAFINELVCVLNITNKTWHRRYWVNAIVGILNFSVALMAALKIGGLL